MTRLYRVFREIHSWNVLAIAIVTLTSVPAIAIMRDALVPATANWSHIKEYLLTDYIINTAVLFGFSGFFASMLGLSLAYLITVFDFPLRNFFRWALILPLSIPAYIGAYTYSGMVDYTGAVTKLLSWAAGRLILLDIMSVPGAIFIFTFFLFPYVYVISRGFLAKFSAPFIESARMLGKSPRQIFLTVVLPLSRGVAASGCALVLMEVANDYGVVSFFGIPTFSVAIFKVWFGMGDIHSAVRLSLYLMGFVLAAVLLEKALRGQKRFSITTAKPRELTRQRLQKYAGWLAAGYCLLVFGFGFVFPVIQLLVWALLTYTEAVTGDFIQAAANTLVAAAICAAVIVVCAAIITNSARISRSAPARLASKLTVLGYSIPGAVIALGVLIFFAALSKLTEAVWNYSLLTSVFMLYFAYIVRFLAVGCSTIENGFDKVGKTFFEASRTLGRSITATFFQVDLKMILPSMLGAFALVFVDMTKELPLTLILRPFNYNTLASKVYEYAHDERIQYSAPAALIIIAVCIVSVYYLSKAEKE
ncbi:MAG: iron ABC transporter permease [Negativicutes bacterium]|nr:iron ABC transporter permease [Negativicutes bacterium]